MIQSFYEQHSNTCARVQVMNDARRQLVSALKYGQTLYVRMANSAAHIVDMYSDDEHLPLSVFDAAVVADATRRFVGAAGENMRGSDHPFAKVIRDEDTGMPRS